MSARRRRAAVRAEGRRALAFEPSSDPKGRIQSRGAGYWFVSGLILFALSYIDSVTFGIGWDESWFLQVVHRVTSGEVLYRDVFFSATPLSVYVAEAFARVFGTEILVVKALVALCFLLTVLLSYRIARQLDSCEGFPFVVIALLVYGRHGPTSLYNPLANLFLLISFSATLSWRESEKKPNKASNARARYVGALAIAGVAAGLCFATKQNLGVYTLAALLLTVLLGAKGLGVSGQRPARALLLVLALFTLTPVLILLPVWFSGGTEKLVEYGVLSRGIYLRYGYLSYLDGFRIAMSVDKTAGSINNLAQIHQAVQFLLPFPTLAALLLAWLRGSANERARTTTVFLFVGAALMGLYPHANLYHLIAATPPMLLGLTYAWYQIRSGLAAHWVRLVTAGALLWFGIGLCFTLLLPLMRIKAATQLSTLPHFRAALIGVAINREIPAFAKTLVETTGGEHVLIISRYAGFYYLAMRLRNPTPFDFPYMTAFGRNGQEEAIAAIARGQIRFVCIDPEGEGDPMMPPLIMRYVNDRMELSRNLGFCTLYRVRP